MLRNSDPSTVPSPSKSKVSTRAPSSSFVNVKSNVLQSCSLSSIGSIPLHWSPLRPANPPFFMSHAAAAWAILSTALCRSSSFQRSTHSAHLSSCFLFCSNSSSSFFRSLSSASLCLSMDFSISTLRFILKKRLRNSEQLISPSPSRSKISHIASSSSAVILIPKAFLSSSANTFFVISLPLNPSSCPTFPPKDAAALVSLLIAEVRAISSLSIVTLIL
mmetsp:Transcript_18336/g.38149  ORF Transcript_18336/g.38149 Transcript_18336/m.38149 type:complete len:219 (-) Transcript_18336:495-1151(-)